MMHPLRHKPMVVGKEAETSSTIMCMIFYSLLLREPKVLVLPNNESRQQTCTDSTTSSSHGPPPSAPGGISKILNMSMGGFRRQQQKESPAIADKPARRKSLPKIAPIRRAYNVVADNTGLSSFV